MAGNPIAAYAAPTVITDAATQTIDCSAASHFSWTLGASRTASTFLNPVGGQVITIEVTQDATGSRVITWPSNVTWPGVNNSAPLLQTQAAGRDLYRFTWNPTAAQWRGELIAPVNIPAAKFTLDATGVSTLVAGDITGAAFVTFSTSNATPGTKTTRTATLMYADDPAAYVGKTWMLLLDNIGSNTLTLGAGAGVTITGTATAATNTTRLFCCTFTSATAATLQSVSVGSIS